MDKKNHFSVRIKDLSAQNKIEELVQRDRYRNKNDVINECVMRSIEELYNEAFNFASTKLKLTPQKSENEVMLDVTKLLKAQSADFLEVKIGLLIIEKIVSSLFNVKTFEVSDNLKNDFEAGILDSLPGYLKMLKGEDNIDI